MQIIYISNRPKNLNPTLQQVQVFMPFIKKVLVLCPKEKHQEIICPGGLEFQLLADQLFESVFSDPDLKNNHVFRNYLLRVELLKRPEVEEEFIMSDDDYRPIKPVELSFFKKDGKYRCYYFYDLAQWTAKATEFDRGMHSTFVLLNYFQFKTLGFAAHMPQMINKKLFAEAASFFKPHSRTYPICEWTSYFNYALKKYPDLFHTPEVYQTLAWPELPLIWPWYVKPQQYTFENYYPSLYESGGVLEGLNDCPNLTNYDQVNLAKICRMHEIEVGRTELPYHPSDPLRRGWIRSILAKLTWLFAILYRRMNRK